jgi:hypothetical protein
MSGRFAGQAKREVEDRKAFWPGGKLDKNSGSVRSGQCRCAEVRPASNFFGPSLVYTNTNGSEMNNIIEDNEKDQFANGQSNRDLRVSSDAMDLEIQLMEAIDNIGDFLHFVEWSTKSETVQRFYARCPDQTSKRRPVP